MCAEIVRCPVALGDRSYEVLTGPGLLVQAEAEIAPLLKRPRLAVITDDHVGPLHLDALRAALPGIEMPTRHSVALPL